MTQTRTTKLSRPKTIYRKCACGETAHDAAAEKFGGTWEHVSGTVDESRLVGSKWRTVYKCRNCSARIVGPEHRSALETEAK